MPRLAGPVLAAAVVAIAAAAVLDAVTREASAPPPSERLRTAAERLRVAGVAGELVWSDEDCGRHALRLPSLERRDFKTRGCGVFTRRDNLGVADGAIAWFAYPGPGGSTVVLPREAVAAEVGDAFSPREAAWLGGLRYAAVFEGPRTVVALFEGTSLLFRSDALGATRARVRASPLGGYFAVVGRDRRLAVYDRRARPVGLPESGRAVAWSPDERFAAVAADGSVTIVPARGGAEIASLEVAAVDVDWRSAGGDS